MSLEEHQRWISGGLASIYIYIYIYNGNEDFGSKGRLTGWALRENVLTAREIETGKFAFLPKNEKRVPGVLWLQWQLDLAGQAHQQAEPEVPAMQ